MLDLKKFQTQLEEMQAQFRERIEALDSDIKHKKEPVEKDFAEQATQSENDDVLNALDAESKMVLIEIDQALFRIKESHFGLCVSCGKSINEKRLETIPYAALCIECAEKE